MGALGTRIEEAELERLRLLEKRVACYYVEEDAAERGIEPGCLLEGLVPVERAKLAALFAGYDQVHRW